MNLGWLTSSQAPWWAAIVTSIAAALLAYLLTSRSSRREIAAAEERTRSAEKRADSAKWRERKLEMYSEFAAAIVRQRQGVVVEDEEVRRLGNMDAARWFQMIKMVAPDHVADAAGDVLTATKDADK